MIELIEERGLIVPESARGSPFPLQQIIPAKVLLKVNLTQIPSSPSLPLLSS